MNSFKGFIFEQQLPDALTPTTNNPDHLTPFQFIAKDALFYGAEAEITIHLLDTEADRLHLDLMSDYVRAEETTDHEPLPRMPPARVGGALRYEHGPWTAGIDLRHAFRQNRFTSFETSTADYTLLGGDLSYHFALDRWGFDLFVRASNLTNEEARVHTSFLKNFAPLPGRDFTFGVRAAF
jgi:iron complex outermembrane receptor protein